MEKKLLSSKFIENKIPESYVFPQEKRPGEHAFLATKAKISIIDLQDGKNRIEQLIKASQDLGLFQVINHGVVRELMNEAMETFKKVFDLPLEEKSKINMNPQDKYVCKLYTSSYNYETEETHYWRDALRHSCSPLEECIKFWPENPNNYREIVGALVIELKDLGSRILELISQGIGLERGYFGDKLSEDHFLTVNHYPSCPDPRLTLGLSKHSDPNLITILLPGQVAGLQVFKDGQWMVVETLPNAFLVIIGNQLEIVSNGKLRSGVHRVVTNTSEARTSAAFFINPSLDCIVEPAKPLEAENDQPLYKAFKYKEFFTAYTGPSTGDTEAVLEAFKIKS